ncbi:hypothetical protein [Bradyrhizobium ottawaense]|uniref:hypothetical protein n=1 Tax=Bradyrhizobium ottawaense TaxID=931866 RepID=UPI0027D5A578|nr:hypothetical protein BwSG10_13820 [Bradyrhizobium ottawaense]GMO94763.1 hypothetical protein BwDG23_13820 [Bradyrhizobium ottawaense]GMP05959.1 hypothetical protein BwSH20_47500 [Bradyrhizobium ottawaense]GMP16566.1 hypothetical protein BwSH12_25680 [Bradyrhizobium ottawaense]
MNREIRNSNTKIAIAVPIAMQVAITMAVVLLVGTRGWDDGAITLAYSKTFAATGRIALTPLSEQVEGFSTIAWFLINSFVALFQPSFATAIAVAQGMTGLFFCLSILQIWLLTKDLKLDKFASALLLSTYAALGMSLSEIANGMEMPLLCFTGVGVVRNLYFRSNLLQAAAFGSVFLLTRFEAMVYYAFILAPLLYERRTKDFVILALTGTAVLGGTEALRLWLFSDWVPNTIYAKMQPPYHEDNLRELVKKVSAAFEVVRAMPLLFSSIAVIVYLHFARFLDAFNQRTELFTKSLYLFAPMFGVIAFNSAIGTNWGYVGRMQTLVFPFALLLFGFWSKKLELFRSELQRSYVLIATIVTVVVSWWSSAKPPLSQAYLTIRSQAQSAPFGVTPASYRLTGLAVDRIRELTGRASITFLTPDVGGVGLCCSRVRIVDLGILANRILAHQGYGALDEVISTERPEVIEAHEMWAKIPMLYKLASFTQSYEPLIIDNTRMYVRRDVAKELLVSGFAVTCSLEDKDCRSRALIEHRYALYSTKDDDFEFLKSGYFVDVTSR